MIIPPIDNYEQISYVVTILAVGGGILLACGKFFKRIAVSTVQKFRSISSAFDKIDIISKEFTPNHGSSMKDVINKIQSDLAKNTELTEKIATRQKWIFDNREMPIFESDEQGHCVWVNIAYMNLVKRDMNFLLGNGWKNVIAPEDRERVVENWESCVKDGRDSEDTYMIVDANGVRTKVFTAACKTGKFGYVGAMKILKSDEHTI